MNKWCGFEKQTSNKSTDSIYIPPNKLDYGKYRFNVTANVSIVVMRASQSILLALDDYKFLISKKENKKIKHFIFVSWFCKT